MKATYYENDNLIKITVRDSGAGMPQNVLDKLKKKESYTTFDNSLHMNKEGIGLGLNICRKLIDLLGP